MRRRAVAGRGRRAAARRRDRPRSTGSRSTTWTDAPGRHPRARAPAPAHGRRRARRPARSRSHPDLVDRPSVAGARRRRASRSAAEHAPAGFLGVAPRRATCAAAAVGGPRPIIGARPARQSAVARRAARRRSPACATRSSGGQPRDPNGPISVVGVGRLAGERQSRRSDDPRASSKAVAAGLLVAGFNLVRCSCSTCSRCCRWTAATSPARCGRRLRRWFARLRGRPDPGPVDVAKLLPVAYVVVACCSSASLLILADIVNPVNIAG